MNTPPAPHLSHTIGAPGWTYRYPTLPHLTGTAPSYDQAAADAANALADHLNREAT